MTIAPTKILYNLIYLLWSVVRRFILRDYRRNIVNFPYSIHGGYGSPIFFEGPLDNPKKNKGHFIRFYEERFFSNSKKIFADIVNIQKIHNPKIESVKGQIANKKISFLAKEDCVIPISNLKNNNNFEVVLNGKKNTFVIPPKRFFYLRFKKKDSAKIINKDDFFLGEKIPLKDRYTKKNKLVLAIFIDGFADLDFLFKKNLIKKYLPNTHKFFSKGTIFKNHYSNAGWSLPGFANIFTGRHIHDHGMFHPRSLKKFKPNMNLLSEYFKKNGYLTSSIGGNWRANPFYGYNRGFDRLIYKRDMASSELISNFLDHYRAFEKRSHFSLLAFHDIHHFLDDLPEISIQTRRFPYYLDEEIIKEKERVKSVARDFNPKKIDVFFESIKKLDDDLNLIYKFLNEKINKNKYLVSIFTDHGQPFLKLPEKELMEKRDYEPRLTIASRKIVWFIRGKGIPKKQSHELTDNCDILETLIKKSNLKKYKANGAGRLPTSIGGTKKKNYTIAQTIFPNKRYESVITDGKFELSLLSKENINQIRTSKEKPEFTTKILSKTKKIDKSKEKKFLLHSKKIFSDATNFIIKNSN